MSTWEEKDAAGIDYETPVDENGIKKVIHFSTNEDGKRVKVVKTVKVTTYQKKVNKRAEERKKRWVKFGRCANAVGKEQGISYVGDEVAFVLGEAQKKQREKEEQEKKDKQQIDAMYQKLISASGRPGIPVQTTTTALESEGPAAWRPSWKKDASAPPSAPASASAGGSPGAGKYVPPSKRDGVEGEQDLALRISNISDETTQEDLWEFFSQFGKPNRVNLVTDKRTGESRGFAFVNYNRKSDAEAVLHRVEVERQKLGLHNFIFNIEWSKQDRK